MRRTFLVGLTAALSLSGCSDTASPDPSDAAQVAVELVVEDLASPVFLTAPPGDDRLFIVERAGRIVIVEAGVVRAEPFLDIRPLVTSGGERGLLGMAFHPQYAVNGQFFVNYTDSDNASTEVVRYTVSDDPAVADGSSRLSILSVTQPFANHNAGMLAFGPDGMLYVGLGDGGSTGDPLNHAQRPETLLGSMLRLDVDGGTPYAIPADNPFVGHPTARPEIWAYGLRNPWRYSFDRATGDLYIADVGERIHEEVNFQPVSSPGGQNYGWRIMEGIACYNPPSGCPTGGLTLPVHEYTHVDGCAITGGYVYRGSAVPAILGRYFYADFCTNWVRSILVSDGIAFGLRDHMGEFGPLPGIVSFGEDGHGELYTVSLNGRVYRLVEPTP